MLIDDESGKPGKSARGVRPPTRMDNGDGEGGGVLKRMMINKK